ncbi:chemotaxis protein CheD [Silvibacterium dinghuense]|uniref:Probable chemoreceptor glutamine deamidase CheD n=1 Tax=Silvibacterium dinghuense TaxID=1560006 RepID=A0A4Q1SDH6_9BACT|nr:chemotaxis protein CheD [Silvibacterium dinghuense]GGH10951.1 putative chemoreceptor glutamine deamidase CheD [Silvibacterium dinghuense]
MEHLQLKAHHRIYIGEVYASSEPLILQTLLGSCVAVCLRDPVSQVGGMNHILLPWSSSEAHETRFGVHAMELLINETMKRGALRSRLEAKAFGAANVLHVLQRPSVGEMNAAFVREFLATEGIPLLGHRLGGTQALQVSFRTDTGRTLVRTADGSRLQKIVHEEESYRIAHRGEEDATGDITLF